MEDILSGTYTKKIDFLFYIEYKKKDDLEDESHIELIASSHGAIYKIHQDEKDNKGVYYIKKIPEDKIEDLFFNYIKVTKEIEYKNFYLLTPESIYFEENRQDYHKMHFDILSNDKCKGLIFFKHKMIEIDAFDMESIFEDMKKFPKEDIIEYYKNEQKELNDYINGIYKEYDEEDMEL